jgi:hypothetical protein
LIVCSEAFKKRSFFFRLLGRLPTVRAQLSVGTGIIPNTARLILAPPCEPLFMRLLAMARSTPALPHWLKEEDWNARAAGHLRSGHLNPEPAL